jgi:aspartyl/glutamyl-tRNA(Asn/Gln) amidotransferase C subunit
MAETLDIHYVAHLARIELTPEEEKTFGEQLGHVLTYIEKLREVDVSSVEPTAHAVPLSPAPTKRAPRCRTILPCAPRPPRPAACSSCRRLWNDATAH